MTRSYRAMIRMVAHAYRWYFATLRVVALMPDGRATTPDAYRYGEQIFALTERDTVALAGIMTARRFTVLVAQGRDGDWATAALEAIGCAIVRGSSRRGGATALSRLIRDRHTARPSEPRGPIALVVDGPLGPSGIAKPGAAMLAEKSARPMYALGAAARHQLTLEKTWAKIYVPLPFTRVVIALEEVQGSGGGAPRALNNNAVTYALARARERADDAVGRPREPGRTRSSAPAGSARDDATSHAGVQG